MLQVHGKAPKGCSACSNRKNHKVNPASLETTTDKSRKTMQEPSFLHGHPRPAGPWKTRALSRIHLTLVYLLNTESAQTPKYFSPSSSRVMPGIKKPLPAADCAREAESAGQTMLLALQHTFTRTTMDCCACLQHQSCPQNSVTSPRRVLVTFWEPLVTEGGKKMNVVRTKSTVTMCWGVRRSNFPHV